MANPNSSPEDRDAIAVNLYREKVQPLLGDPDASKFVVVDLSSGDFEVDEYELEAEIRLRERRPGADIYSFLGDEHSRIIYIGGASLRLIPSPRSDLRETDP